MISYSSLLLLLIPIFAIFDRWCGGGLGWKSTFKGRPIYYVMLLIPLFFVINWQLGVILTGWCIWREPKWKLFGGSLTPTTKREIAGTFARHLLILPVILVCLTFPLGAWIGTLITLVVWAALATYLAIENATYSEHGVDINASIELGRGALFGIAMFTVLNIIQIVN